MAGRDIAGESREDSFQTDATGKHGDPLCCDLTGKRSQAPCQTCAEIDSGAPCCGAAGMTMVDIPGYQRCHFVEGVLDTPVGPVPKVKTILERPDRIGAAMVRLGIGRGRYRVAPGLYAVGTPERESPVLVTANYKLSFDALRRELSGVDAWILVLDTSGVNVWCAAGKSTFGTAELTSRVKAVGLEKLVSHRKVVVPQLGAPGVAGHEVKASTGFRVVFGPVRASDVRAFLASGMKATPQMRRVHFSAWERVVVGLVEFVNERKTMAQLACALFVLAGIGADVFSISRAWLGLWSGFTAYALGFAAGNVLTPLALPWLPGRSFSFKGAVAGALAGLGVLALGEPGITSAGLWLGSVVAGSWYGMNFTGSSTFTSPSGVEKEMRRAIPFQAAGLILAVVLWRLGLAGV